MWVVTLKAVINCISGFLLIKAKMSCLMKHSLHKMVKLKHVGAVSILLNEHITYGASEANEALSDNLNNHIKCKQIQS